MSPVAEAAAAAPNLAAIKQRQQATWASGDYAMIGTTLQIVGESPAEAVDVRAGDRVLDLSAVSQAKLNAVARQMNERPRKTLGYETPAERYRQTVASIG